MTCIGFAIAGLRQAVAWCDTETYRGKRSEPSGHACKISINPVAGLVAVSTGTLYLVREVAAVIGLPCSLADVREALPSALRFARQEMPEGSWARQTTEAGACAVVGYDDALGRVVGYVFNGARDFAPSGPLLQWSSPAIHAVGCDAHSVVAAAQEQLTLLRRSIPAATGGSLIVAEIDGPRIAVRPLVEMVSGAPIEAMKQVARQGMAWTLSRVPGRQGGEMPPADQQSHAGD